MIDIECHERCRCCNIIAIGLVRSYRDISNTSLWLGNDWCCIFVFGRFETPSHFNTLLTQFKYPGNPLKSCNLKKVKVVSYVIRINFSLSINFEILNVIRYHLLYLEHS